MKACALFLLATACTTTQVLVLPAEGSPLQSANFGLRDRSAKLKLREKESFEVSSIALDQTAADFQDKAGLRRSVPLAAVEEIKYLSPDHPRLRGLLEGAGIGFLSGAVGGFAIGAAAGAGKCDCAGPPASIVLGVAGATLGLLAGGAIGAGYGHHDAIVVR
jgi:hypothetical protein